MNIGAISAVASRYGGSFNPSIAKMRGGQMDPSQMLGDVSKKFIQTNDSDGDGSLSSTEVSGLSKDTFSKIDTSGDGKLSQDELVTAAKSQMEAMRKEFETNGPSGVQKMMESTQASPGSELMKAMMPQPSGSGAAMGPPPMMSGQPQSGQVKSTLQSILSAYQNNNDAWSGILSENRASAMNLVA